MLVASVSIWIAVSPKTNLKNLMSLLPVSEQRDKEKEVKVIIKITREEKDYLLNEKHLVYGDGGLHHSTARHRRTYWMTESRRNLQYLDEFRQRQITG